MSKAVLSQMRLPLGKKSPRSVCIASVEIDNISTEELIYDLKAKGGLVFTPNVDHLVKLQTDADFYRAYQAADYRVCDSKILYFSSRILRKPLKEKISGSDLLPSFYQKCKSDEDISIFLLGGAPSVAERAAQRINSRVSRCIVSGWYSPKFGFENSKSECLKMVREVNESKANVLVVGLGAPKQENWIFQYREHLKYADIIFAAGATIDFEAGKKCRAPKWISELGMEWCYRLFQEPRRLAKRYLIDDIAFLMILLRELTGTYRPPRFTSRADSFSNETGSLSLSKKRS